MLLLLACTPTPTPIQPAPIDINPFIATGGPGFRVGSSTPAAGLPFGMVKVGPDTRFDGASVSGYHCSGYYYEDNEIVGFSHFHLHGVGVPDYGNILFMPVPSWDNQTTPEAYTSTFSHENEAADAGWYEVKLDNGTLVELSATPHAAHHRYTWDKPSGAVVIDLAWNLHGSPIQGQLNFDPQASALWGLSETAGSFTGGGLPVWFYAEVDGGFSEYGSWSDSEILPQQNTTGVSVGGWFVPNENPASIRVAISQVSWEKARENLWSQLPAQAIETTQTQAQSAWHQALSPVAIYGGTQEQQTIFWTALYHAISMPQQHADQDGEYIGFDRQAHNAWNFTYHSDMSLWDTYRTAHPLYILLYPDKARDFAESLTRMAIEGNAFPRWPAAVQEGGSMLGQPATIVLAETWLKGIQDWNIEEAYPRLLAQQKGAPTPYNGRPAINEQLTYGYLPADMMGGSVAWNQELAWSDYAMARLAGALGKTDDAAYFMRLAKTYQNQYDPTQGFFHGRNRDGSFETELDPLAWEDEYTEGNAWQYLWPGFFDAEGLAQTLGGKEIALERLRTFMNGMVEEGVIAFPQSYYWHGNEPDIHAAWLFALWGSFDETLYWVRWIQENLYHNDPDGLSGNDDGGTLSSWYIFASLGIYPIAGSEFYVVTAPLFDSARIQVAGGEVWFHREGQGNHIESVTINGEPLDFPLIRHDQLVPGTEIRVRLSEKK